MAPRVVLVGVLTAAALSAVFGGVAGPARLPLTLPFLLAIPGLAWLNRPVDAGLGGAIAIAAALSLAFETGIATLLVYLELWSPKVGFGLLIGITVTGLIWTSTKVGRATQPRSAGTPTAPARLRESEAKERSAIDPSDAPILIFCATCSSRMERTYRWLSANSSLTCPKCGADMTGERASVVEHVERIRRLTSAGRPDGRA